MEIKEIFDTLPAWVKYTIAALACAAAAWFSVSCMSLRTGSKTCDKDGNCTWQWYDSTIISRPSRF